MNLEWGGSAAADGLDDLYTFVRLELARGVGTPGDQFAIDLHRKATAHFEPGQEIGKAAATRDDHARAIHNDGKFHARKSPKA